MRKIIVIVSMVLVVALATLVTLSLVIKKNYSSSISLANPDVITIYKDGAKLSYFEDTNPTEYNAIVDMINNSTTTTYMNAFIQSTMLYKSNLTTISSSSLTLTQADKIYIQYIYNETSPLMFDGEVYVNTLTEVNANYREIVFEISDTDSMAITQFYFSDLETTTTFYKKYTLTTRMNTAELYDYIDEMYIPA